MSSNQDKYRPWGVIMKNYIFPNDCIKELNANYNGEQFIIMAGLHHWGSSAPFPSWGTVL